MSQNLTTKEKVVWYGGGGVVITSLSVVLLHSLGYNLGWLSIGLDKHAFQMAKYTTGVEAEQGPIYQVSKDKPILLEPSLTQPVIPSRENTETITTTLIPKEEVVEISPTNIVGLVTSEEMTPLSFAAPSKKEEKKIIPSVTEIRRSYKVVESSRTSKPIVNTVRKSPEVKPERKPPSCHEQVKQNLKLTPWCEDWKNGLTKSASVEKPTISEAGDDTKKVSDAKKPTVDPRKPYVEKWEAQQEALRQRRLKEWNEAQALKAKRAEYHRKWKENEERKKIAQQQAKSNPVNLIVPTDNKPPVKKLPSCQEQHKQGLTLSAWCKVNWKPPVAVAKVIKPVPVTKTPLKKLAPTHTKRTQLTQAQKDRIFCKALERRNKSTSKCQELGFKPTVKHIPPVRKPVKTKPAITQAKKDKQFCENKLKAGKTTPQCMLLGYNLAKKKPMPVRKSPHKEPKHTLTQKEKDKAYCETLSKQGKTTKACVRLGYHKPTKRVTKLKYGNIKKPAKKCSNGVDQLTYAQKLRLSKAGVNVNTSNCDNGWRPPKGAEKYWTGTSECLNPDGSYMIPNFKCSKWKK